MMKEIIGKTLVIAGTAIAAIPFASVAVALFGILSVIWLKDKINLIFNPPLKQNISF